MMLNDRYKFLFSVFPEMSFDLGLNNVDFSFSSFLGKIVFYRANLKNVKFTEVEFKKVCFFYSKIEYTDFSRAKIETFEANSKKFKKVVFTGIECEKADFYDVNLEVVRFLGAKFGELIFSKIKSKGVNFSGSTFGSVIFVDVSDENSDFSFLKCKKFSAFSSRFKDTNFLGRKLIMHIFQ